MKPAAINLDGDREIYQGDDYSIDVYLYQSDGITLQDLTGYTAAKSQIRATAASSSTIADFVATIAADQTATPGKVTLTLDEDITAAFPTNLQAVPVWDFEIVDAAGNKETWVAGLVTIVAEVTRG